jgi:uncharacterized protein
MRIELDRLEEQGGKFSRVYEVDELLLDDEEVRLVEPVEIQGRARRVGSEVELRGRLSARLEVPCSRCLNPVEVPISTEFTERFVRAVSWAADEQHELQEEDLNLAVFDGEGIELDDLAREEILLAVPASVLCGQDCQGLCPACGTDRNQGNCQCETNETDSRWQKLKELQM